MFEHLVPSWLHCLGRFRKWGLAGQALRFESYMPFPVRPLCFLPVVRDESPQHSAPAAMY